MEMIAPSGVRISWLTVASSSAFAWLACSAAARAARSRASVRSSSSIYANRSLGAKSSEGRGGVRLLMVPPSIGTPLLMFA
jgi:hypothetical protein